jgi:hypothetical protein
MIETGSKIVRNFVYKPSFTTASPSATLLTKRAMAPSTRNGQRGRASPKPRDAAAPYIRQPSTTQSQTGPPPPSRDIDDVLNYYDRALIPKEKVCPFSAPSRRNPCTTHANPKKRKDIIEKHLLQIKQKGYDDQHPANDPLWTSWEVDKYWLAARPEPLISKEEKRAARSRAAKRSYRTRLEREQKEADTRKRQYEEGKISFAEYKFVLVGDKRRKAEVEYRMKNLRGNLERRIGELEAKQTSTAPLNTADQQQLDELTTSLRNIKESKERLYDLNDAMLSMCTEIMRCWGRSNTSNMGNEMGGSGETFMSEMVFPSECNLAAFYQYAALLQPSMHWDDMPFKGSHLRNMKKALQVYAQDLQSEISPDDEDAETQMQQIDDIVANFNACCDIVENDEKNANDLGPTGVQDWLDMQQQLWTNAKANQRRWVNLASGWRAPLQTARVYDKFVDVIGQIVREQETDKEIASEAQNVLDSENGEAS